MVTLWHFIHGLKNCKYIVTLCTVLNSIAVLIRTSLEIFFYENLYFFCLLLLGSEGEAPHKVTWSDYMEAALSKAAPDCCFKHVSMKS